MSVAKSALLLPLTASEKKKMLPASVPISLWCLFPFERVLDRIFDAADGILNLALKLIGLAFRL
jgi:hypothetical protein